jgi:hypothetical protein
VHPPVALCILKNIHCRQVLPHERQHVDGSGHEFIQPVAGALVRNGAIFVILLAVLAAINLRSLFSGGPADVTPLKAPLLKDLPQFQGQYADDMLWGTYRSGLYFGMRTRWERRQTSTWHPAGSMAADKMQHGCTAATDLSAGAMPGHGRHMALTQAAAKAAATWPVRSDTHTIATYQRLHDQQPVQCPSP